MYPTCVLMYTLLHEYRGSRGPPGDMGECQNVGLAPHAVRATTIKKGARRPARSWEGQRIKRAYVLQCTHNVR